MSKSDFIKAGIEPELMEGSEAILQRLGLSMADAVTMMCEQIIIKKALPFPAKVPNAETIAAFNEDTSNSKRYTDSRTMMADILAEDQQ